MYRYEFLNLINLKKFRRLVNKDYEFTKLQHKFLDEYENLPFIMKLFRYKNILLLKENEKYIGYMWVTRYEFKSYKINRIILENNYDIKLYTGFFNKFPVGAYFEIEGTFEQEELIMLERLGFKKFELLYEMKKEILQEYNISLEDNLQLKLFKKGKDEELRKDIQNKIFKAKGRADIEICDIVFEENQEYYIENASYFLMHEDEAIGYGQLIKEYENLYIVNLGVIPEFRGKAYSSFILRKLINIAISMGYKDIFLKCNEKNIAALTIYKKHEFEIISKYKMLGFTKTNKEKEII